MKYIMFLLGYTTKKPSLLMQTILDTTHGSWLNDLYHTNRFNDYLIK
jgi:hypothetical protein